MKIKVTKDEKRRIENYQFMPLFISAGNIFLIYGDLKFEKEVKTINTLFGKKEVETIYMTECLMKLSDDVENEMYCITDEIIMNIFKEYDLQLLRNRYLKLIKKYKVFCKFINDINKKIKQKH